VFVNLTVVQGRSISGWE